MAINKYLDSAGLSVLWNTIKSYIANNTTTVLDVYPVGSYYETSNASFNPNTAWGGTWEKLEDGRVLIAANSTYTTEGGSATVSYTPESSNGSVGATTLTSAQSGSPAHSHVVPAHGHGHSNPTVTYPSSTSSYAGFLGSNSEFTSVRGNLTYSGSADYNTLRVKHSGLDLKRIAVTMPARTCTVSGGGVSNAAAFNTNNSSASDATASHTHTFTGKASTIDVMQPYTPVYRWHRTA